MAQLFNTGEYANVSERETAEFLRSELPASWLIIANRIVPTQRGADEIDFIVVADHRIILIDDKYWRGPITGSDQFWTQYNVVRHKSPLNKIEMCAKRFRGYLRQKGVDLPGEHPIAGFIYLSYPNTVVNISDSRQANNIGIPANVIKRLLALNEEGKRTELDFRDLRTKLKDTLLNLDERNLTRFPKQIGDFGVEGEVEQRGETLICNALNRLDLMHYRLHVYRPKLGEPTGDFDREIDALRKLQPTHVVPSVGAPIQLGDDGLRIVPVTPADGTAWGALPPPTNAEEVLLSIALAARAFEALASIHAAGVTHRSIDPLNVFVTNWKQDPRVVFTDFVFARMADAAATVGSSADELGFEDPYLAPEISKLGSYGYADPSSDVYSLALVVLEHVSGFDVAEIRESIDIRNALPIDHGWPYFTDDFIVSLATAFEVVLTGDSYGSHPRPSAREFAKTLKAIASEAHRPRETSQVAAPSKYEIISELGRGQFSDSFLVRHIGLGERFAAKRYRKGLSADVLDQIKNEFIRLWRLPSHPSVPKVLEPDLSNPDFQFFMEYIEGETLASTLTLGPLDRDQWANVMRGLLDVVEHLRINNVVHRDIKPANIVIRDSDGKPVLIDFGVAALQERKTSYSGSPGYSPPEALASDTVRPEHDLYASAVTLFEALTGVMPFEVGKQPYATLPSSIPFELEPLCDIMLKAVSLNPEDRFNTAAELRGVLEAALVSPPKESISARQTDETDIGDRSWPANLRGLFRSSSRGNSDNRGLDSEFAKTTYVETMLDTRLWPEIWTRRPAVVFLSGNPGDGKTAFLAGVRDRLLEKGAEEKQSDPSGWEIGMDGHSFRAVYDASESANGMSATEQLKKRLKGLEGNDPATTITVLVAINDGRLAEVADRELALQFPGLESQLKITRSRRMLPPELESRVWIVDLKRRAYVSLTPETDHGSAWRGMLNTLVVAEHWSTVPSVIETFPPAGNAAALRNPVIAARLEKLFLLAHLRGDRHTTVRDLRSALAMVITGDLDYDNFEELTTQADRPQWAFKYWNIAFTTETSRDLVLGDLRWLDPARFAHPDLERYLYFHRRDQDAGERAKFFINGIDEPPPAGDDLLMIREWIKAFKRRLYFEGAGPTAAAPVSIDPAQLLPYRSAEQTIDVLNGASDGANLLDTILLGIGCSDGISAARDPQFSNDLVLEIKNDPRLRLEVVTTLPRDRFSLRPEVAASGGNEVVEVTPRTILLEYRSEQMGKVAPTKLNLDLIEVLWRLARGMESSSTELQPLIEELAPFKSRLQRDVSDKLLVIDNGRKHLIRKEGIRLVRSDVA